MPDADRSIRVGVKVSVDRIIGRTDVPSVVPNPMMAPMRLCRDWHGCRQDDTAHDQGFDKRSHEFSHDVPRNVPMPPSRRHHSHSFGRSKIGFALTPHPLRLRSARQHVAAWMTDEKQARPAVKEKIILRSKERPNRVRTASYLVRFSLFGQIQRFAALQQSQRQPGRTGFIVWFICCA
jgi:hypothetical protein